MRQTLKWSLNFMSYFLSIVSHHPQHEETSQQNNVAVTEIPPLTLHPAVIKGCWQLLRVPQTQRKSSDTMAGSGRRSLSVRTQFDAVSHKLPALRRVPLKPCLFATEKKSLKRDVNINTSRDRKWSGWAWSQFSDVTVSSREPLPWTPGGRNAGSCGVYPAAERMLTHPGVRSRKTSRTEGEKLPLGSQKHHREAQTVSRKMR